MNISGVGGFDRYRHWPNLGEVKRAPEGKAAEMKALDLRKDLPPKTRSLAVIKIEEGMPADEAILAAETVAGKGNNPGVSVSFADIFKNEMKS